MTPNQLRFLRTIDVVNITRRARLWLLFVSLYSMSGLVNVYAQSALDGFDPAANAPIHAVVVQPDGKILIGGEFTTLSPNGGVAVTRRRLARLNRDGSLDTGFNPNSDGTVLCIVVQPDGKILVAGGFVNIGGQTRNHLARLDGTTGLADSFNPDADLFVISLALQPDGKVLAGGIFTTIGGQTRNSIARLDGATGLADSFDPSASPMGISGGINSIVVLADGKILAGGTFTNIGGQIRRNLARLDGTTGLADSFAPNPSRTILALAVQADGKIIAAGDFSGTNSIGGESRNRIARLDPITGLADSFNPNAISSVRAVVIQPDGKVLAGGFFTTIGGVTRRSIARLDPITGSPDSFDPGMSAAVHSIAVQQDGKVLAGGDFVFATPNGGTTVPRICIARLEKDGRLDRNFNALMAGNARVLATVVQPDGKIVIGGHFDSILGIARTNIARLNTDGTLDMAFSPNANVQVSCLAIQADGKILAGGSFNVIGRQNRTSIARLDATNGLADSFDPDANFDVNSLAVQADGKILVGGNFTSIAGQIRPYLARLDPVTGFADSFDATVSGVGVTTIAIQSDGKILVGGSFFSIGGEFRTNIARLNPTNALADSFNPKADAYLTSIAVQEDGKILAGGYFSTIGGEARRHIARLDSTTGAADSFNPNANGVVNSIAVQADGKILVAGGFSGANSMGGQQRNRIARLDANTGLADSFNPNASGSVFAIVLQADGKIIAGGNFQSVGGQPRVVLARLNNDTMPRQNLTATKNSVTWALEGSSAQFRRVTFELSTNLTDYTPLGEGAASGSNWVLDGLDLTAIQNIYIRARGQYGSGGHSGIDSIQESVRNVFVDSLAQPALVIQLLESMTVVMSWPTNFPTFILEWSEDLNTPSWTATAPAPVVVGTNNVVTTAATGLPRFYRLHSPP